MQHGMANPSVAKLYAADCKRRTGACWITVSQLRWDQLHVGHVATASWDEASNHTHLSIYIESYIYMCVWTIWIDVKLLSVDFGALLVWFDSSWFIFNFHAGGHSISLGLCPTKLPVKWDIRLGQLDVPALISIFVNGNRLSQVPACRFQFFLDLDHCTVFAIWITADLVRWEQLHLART